MAWTPDRAYLSGLEFMSGVVSQVGSTDWAQPSPCAGWQALDVVGHVGQAVRFGTALLSGPQPAFEAPIDPPGLAVEGDPGAWWLALVGPARPDAGRTVAQPCDLRPGGRLGRRCGLLRDFPCLDGAGPQVGSAALRGALPEPCRGTGLLRCRVERPVADFRS